MRISRGGRPVIGFALGDDPYAQAASDLADMQSAVKNGDDLATSLNFTSAVQTYKTAGANGVAVIGPEIDAAGAPKATTSHTQHAQMLNSALAGVAAILPATKVDTDAARGIVTSMVDDYLTALQEGRKAQSVSATKPRTIWPVIVIPAAVGGLILLVQREHHAARR